MNEPTESEVDRIKQDMASSLRWDFVGNDRVGYVVQCMYTYKLFPTRAEAEAKIREIVGHGWGKSWLTAPDNPANRA